MGEPLKNFDAIKTLWSSGYTAGSGSEGGKIRQAQRAVRRLVPRSAWELTGSGVWAVAGVDLKGVSSSGEMG